MSASQNLKNRFLALPERDRRALLLMAAVLLPALLYFLLIFPLQKAHKRIDASLQDAEADRQKVEQWLPLAAASRGGGRSPLNQPLGTLLSDTASQHQLTISSIQPKNDRDVQVRLEDVRWDAALRWLHGLEFQYGVQAQSVSVTPAREPGHVRVTLRMQAP